MSDQLCPGCPGDPNETCCKPELRVKVWMDKQKADMSEKKTEHDLLGDPIPEPLPSGERFRYFDQLVGHKILAVFEGTQCAHHVDVVIVTETKCWLAAVAEFDGDSAHINVSDTWSDRSLSDYVKAKDLLDTGCINHGEYDVLRKVEEEREAVARERQKNLLRRQLESLENESKEPRHD